MEIFFSNFKASLWLIILKIDLLIALFFLTDKNLDFKVIEETILYSL